MRLPKTIMEKDIVQYVEERCSTLSPDEVNRIGTMDPVTAYKSGLLDGIIEGISRFCGDYVKTENEKQHTETSFENNNFQDDMEK